MHQSKKPWVSSDVQPWFSLFGWPPLGCFGSDISRWAQFQRFLSLYLNSLQVWDLIERTFKNSSRNWDRKNQSWSSRSWTLHQQDGIWSLTNVTTPPGSQFVVGRSCGNTLVGFLNPFPEHGFLWMFLPTAQRSVLARRLVGGRRQWVYCIKWAEKRSIQMSSASMQQSVLVRKAVNCRERWAYWNRCMKHILDPMWFSYSAAISACEKGQRMGAGPEFVWGNVQCWGHSECI